jgi:hypothetical protein
MLRPALVLASLLATGCAPEAVGPFAPSPTSHRGGAWQQFCEQAWNVPQASALVSARGADGWELVAMYNGALCYKRPVADPAQSPAGRPSTRAPNGDTSGPLFRDPGF